MDVFQIERTPDGSFSARCRPPADLPWLAGHFPGQPVLPAAIIMELSLAFLRAGLGLPRLKVAGAPSCKFRAPVVPGVEYRLVATPGRSWEICWRQASGDDPLGGDSLVDLAFTVHD